MWMASRSLTGGCRSAAPAQQALVWCCEAAQRGGPAALVLTAPEGGVASCDLHAQCFSKPFSGLYHAECTTPCRLCPIWLRSCLTARPCKHPAGCPRPTCRARCQSSRQARGMGMSGREVMRLRQVQLFLTSCSDQRSSNDHTPPGCCVPAHGRSAHMAHRLAAKLRRPALPPAPPAVCLSPSE